MRKNVALQTAISLAGAEQIVGQSKRHDASREKESGCLRRAGDQKLLKNEKLITYYPLDS